MTLAERLANKDMESSQNARNSKRPMTSVASGCNSLTRLGSTQKQSTNTNHHKIDLNYNSI